jgi:hypothetical protein
MKLSRSIVCADIPEMVRENTRGKAIQSARSLRPESFDGGEFDAVAVALGPIGEAVDIVGFDAVGGADLEYQECIDVGVSVGCGAAQAAAAVGFVLFDGDDVVGEGSGGGGGG